jgi:hypothetical protein
MPNPGMAIFVLFFGMSLVEALGRRDWSTAAFWLGCGVAFWLVGYGFRRKQSRPHPR